MTTSLQALTSHFAQIQFRLRQIVDAPAIERDELLKNLEEFAFRGIPEVTRLDPEEHEHLFKIMERQRNRQFELIEYLKRQLCNVEKMAYESGADILPQSVLVEKQKLIIDQLKNKLKLNVLDEELPNLTLDDIRSQVDSAFGEFVHPLKMQDTLVSQLKTQIVDLERFVAYLQGESVPDVKPSKKNDNSSDSAYQTYNTKMARSRKQSQSDNDGMAAGPSNRNNARKSSNPSETQDLGTKVSSLLLKASTVLNIFAITQLGCSSNRTQKNVLKRTPKGNHWGDLRAQLEVDVQELISLVSSIEKSKKDRNAIQEEPTRKRIDPKSADSDSDDDDDNDDVDDDDDDSDYPSNVSQLFILVSAKYNIHISFLHSQANIYVESSDSSSTPVASARIPSQKNKEYIASVKAEITMLVRKNFAVTLQGLMQHGLRDDGNTNTSLVPFIGCMLPFGQSQHRPNDNDDERGNQRMHVWELILEYYHIKNGDQFNDTPARKLSESFNLDIMGMASQTISNKHTMLTAIGSIIALHAPYKRSYNSHFKAFISAGLK